ncbi:hypothetical protein [Gemmatimonas sp.]|uniref:hypothetical protein n=1 Tax=Gemmatimonas sp. TaxID=1962908 RepID=UPI0035695126
MDEYRLDLSSPPNWFPLEQLSRLCHERAGVPSLAPGDYMYAGRLVAVDSPSIHLYKVHRTRRYLCLDVGGHSYRVRATALTLTAEIERSPFRHL